MPVVTPAKRPMRSEPALGGPNEIWVMLPVKLVSEANAHEHWRQRQRRAKRHRGAAFASLLLPLKRAWQADVSKDQLMSGLERGVYLAPEARATVTITRIAPRDLDSDNLVGSAKHVRDGVADALGIDDRDPRVTWVVEQRRGKVREYACAVRIQWEPAS